MSTKTPEKQPVYGDTVYYVDGDKNRVKAQVTDGTPDDKGAIKVTVVPAAGQPFPVRTKFGNGKTPGTWTWDSPSTPEQEDDSDDA